MKLLYSTALTFPSGLANRLQILAMSKYFVKQLKTNYCLGISKIRDEGTIRADKDILIKEFGVAKSYVLAFRYMVYIKRNQITHLYCRDPRLLFFIYFYNKILFRKKLYFFYEVHEIFDKTVIDKIIQYFLARGMEGFIFVTERLKEMYAEKYKIKTEKKIIAPDGVDMDIFDIPLTKNEARELYNLPKDKKIIGYFGRFRTMGEEKGIGVILKALRELDDNIIFLAMGGKQKSRDCYKKMAQDLGVDHRVIFVEHFSQSILAKYQKACDILLMPFPNTKHYAYYMSPLKMFEYMASKRPVIATDLPSIREILHNEENALLIESGDSYSLARAVERIVGNEELAKKLVSQAYEDVDKYTWEKRVNEIVSNF